VQIRQQQQHGLLAKPSLQNKTTEHL